MCGGQCTVRSTCSYKLQLLEKFTTSAVLIAPAYNPVCRASIQRLMQVDCDTGCRARLLCWQCRIEYWQTGSYVSILAQALWLIAIMLGFPGSDGLCWHTCTAGMSACWLLCYQPYSLSAYLQQQARLQVYSWSHCSIKHPLIHQQVGHFLVFVLFLCI